MSDETRPSLDQTPMPALSQRPIWVGPQFSTAPVAPVVVAVASSVRAPRRWIRVSVASLLFAGMCVLLWRWRATTNEQSVAPADDPTLQIAAAQPPRQPSTPPVADEVQHSPSPPLAQPAPPSPELAEPDPASSAVPTARSEESAHKEAKRATVRASTDATRPPRRSNESVASPPVERPPPKIVTHAGGPPQARIKANCSALKGSTKDVCIHHIPADGRVVEARPCEGVQPPVASCVLDVVREEIASGWPTSDTEKKSYRYGL